MKRQIWLLIGCFVSGTPLLMAQEYYAPASDSDSSNREFHINPGNMMNRMPNPMQGFFGSSNRRYNGYDNRYAAPPAYPPAYAYPGNPPPPGYGYAYPQSAPQVTPPQPAANPSTARTERQSAPMGYRPPENVDGYRFRPRGEAVTSPQAEALKPIESKPYPIQENQAPMENPAYATTPEPLAPITYPEADAKPVLPTARPAPEIVTHEGKRLKFRPLDQPGYSPSLGE